MALKGTNVGRAVKRNSDIVMNTTFTRDKGYYSCPLYNRDGLLLEKNVDLKFQYSQNYTINKDQVEYLVQFRPEYCPEKIYQDEDKKERLGFYLDIPDECEEIRRWMIVGRNHKNDFIRYNVLECNWTFKWIYDGVIYETLGVLRNRNNYNSGVWSDGFVTSVENQAQFIVPTTNATRTIDYDDRFMICDNPLNPKVYEVSKIEDTFPIGVNKITLVQDHFDKIHDNVDEMICNYYNTAVPPEASRPSEVNLCELKCNGVNKTLLIGGSARTITATFYNSNNSTFVYEPEWHFIFDSIETTPDELSSKFVLKFLQGAIKIQARDDRSLANKVLEVAVYDAKKSYYSSIKLEVKL